MQYRLANLNSFSRMFIISLNLYYCLRMPYCFFFFSDAFLVLTV